MEPLHPIPALLAMLLSLIITQGAPAAESRGLQIPPAATDSDRVKSCAELEQEMVSLSPLSYSDRPTFYEDPQRGALLTVGTSIPIAYLLLAYPEFLDYQSKKRIASVNQRMGLLRQLKAERRCFES